uniref:Septin 12 n=1 Tax=Dromaius novaehollandiae TaxID=8790 RepID=A0A8C4JFR2_DRONO
MPCSPAPRHGSSLEPGMEPPAAAPEGPPPAAEPEQGGRELFGYVGIEAVLDQMRIKTMKTGFEFNIMVVGQSGLGKSTMVNTLFKSKVSRRATQPGREERIPKTVQLQSVTHVIEEKGVKMKLTVTDTPGFGDQINNENCWDPIIKYINEQYERYLREEILITRKRKIPDTRVHGCVYFVPPTGHWLRPLDLEFMRRLSKIVNVVPVIAKADTLTLEERAEFKQRIQRDLKAHAISVYPQEDFDEDPDDRSLNDRIREKIPFAVVGADQEHQVNGKRVLGRKTKWGIIEVENPVHCEFPMLRDLLIRSHLQDLKDITHNVHYESYRVRRLNEGTRQALGPVNGLLGKDEAGPPVPQPGRPARDCASRLRPTRAGDTGPEPACTGLPLPWPPASPGGRGAPGGGVRVSKKWGPFSGSRGVPRCPKPTWVWGGDAGRASGAGARLRWAGPRALGGLCPQAAPASVPELRRGFTRPWSLLALKIYLEPSAFILIILPLEPPPAGGCCPPVLLCAP